MGLDLGILKVFSNLSDSIALFRDGGDGLMVGQDGSSNLNDSVILWFNVHGGDGSVIGLGDLRGLSQPS